MTESQDQTTMITENCLKCGEDFEAVQEPDGSATTVCPSCFEYTMSKD